jgi:predicted Zn finger-like uncharacterized protein
MLIVCPNCGTSYGVAMASLRPASGWTRKLRCHRCRWVWQAQLSDTDKLKVAADQVPPVRRAMAAIAQGATDAARSARSALPRLRRATAVLAEELEAGRNSTDRAPSPPASVHAEPAGARQAGTPVTIPLVAGIAAIVARVVGAVRRQHRAWRRSWQLSRWRSWWLSLRISWRQSWWLWRPSLSRLQRIVLALALTDAAIIGERADLVWAMPQTASFFAALGLPVNLRGVHFDRLTATAERRDGEPVLIVQGAIGNSTTESADVPDLRFSIRNAEHQEIYSWTAAPGRGRLSAGRKLVFRSELILPPADTRDVVVRFVDRDDSL